MFLIRISSYCSYIAAWSGCFNWKLIKFDANFGSGWNRSSSFEESKGTERAPIMFGSTIRALDSASASRSKIKMVAFLEVGTREFYIAFSIWHKDELTKKLCAITIVSVSYLPLSPHSCAEMNDVHSIRDLIWISAYLQVKRANTKVKL